jgi:hypothetical protein
MFEKIKNLLINPKVEFEKYEKEEAQSMISSFTTYAMLLFLIPAVCTIIGWGVIGYNVVFMSIKSWEIGIKLGIVVFAGCTASFFISTYLIDALAPSFKSTKNLNRSAQLVAASMTPGAVAGIFCLFPNMSTLMILGALYGGYILFLGLPSMMKAPADQAPIFAVVSILAIIVVYWLVYYILGQVLMGSGASLGASSLNF